jgi:hypothetical protein
VLALIEAGEPALAQSYAEQFGLPTDLVDAAPAAVAAAAKARAAAHLPLALPADRVLLVDQEARLDRCRCVLCSPVFQQICPTMAADANMQVQSVGSSPACSKALSMWTAAYSVAP